MSSDKSADELQKQTRELLRAQQEAYLAAVKEWRKTIASQGSAPTWPTPPPFDALPTPAEIAEASYSFAAKLLADQSRFMLELSKAMSSSEEPR